jgi:predicted CxxxxCH...CXXCH cytochrome family protein
MSVALVAVVLTIASPAPAAADGTDCSACHGSVTNAAPPVDVSGNALTTKTGVGAHQSHLGVSTWHAEIMCGECHIVPVAESDPGHSDTALPAELTWGALATSDGATPTWNGTTCSGDYCHGSTLPEGGATPNWTTVDGTEAACGTCHGLPPAGLHTTNPDCSLCHPNAGAGQTFTIPGQHIDGIVQLDPLTCSSCHGSAANDAPPVDVSGNAFTTETGVGAHQSHLGVSTWHAEIVCTECHVVPASDSDPGHRDTALPAELTWGALATNDGATPSWDGTSCSGDYCHGATLLDEGASPVWTTVDGTQAACGTCHGLPPGGLHPSNPDCSARCAMVRWRTPRPRWTWPAVSLPPTQVSAHTRAT